MSVFYYAAYLGRTAKRDDQGRLTGGFTEQYSGRRSAYGNISPASGIATRNVFGVLPEYDKVIVMAHLPNGLDENARLWIDKKPTGAHDYIVKRIAQSKNGVSIAISRVSANV